MQEMWIMASKSKRSPHFNMEEKELLLQINTDMVNVRECKLGEVNSTKSKIERRNRCHHEHVLCTLSGKVFKITTGAKGNN